MGKKGLGTTAPNPMVGCVVVHGGRIVGEGFTSPYGGPHAEVNAIESVRNKELLSEASLYVSLEPCSHFGKTPPCVDLILRHRIPEVYIGIRDPHEKVAGKGIAKLQAAGCRVKVGILEKECREHHRRFLCLHEKKRPYIILKWAETQDGFIAPDKALKAGSPRPYWISNAQSKQLVHKWRSEEQAILVGTGTVLEDDPKLTVRDWAGKDPIRIVLDRELKIPAHSHVLDGSVQTLVLTQGDLPKDLGGAPTYETVDFSRPLPPQICELLYRRSIGSVLVEGGGKTLQSFLEDGLWDEARVFRGPNRFEKGTPAPKVVGTPTDIQYILDDTLSIYRND